MDVENSLAGGGTHVDADVVSVRAMLLIDHLPGCPEQVHDGGDLFPGQIEKAGGVPAGDDERVAGRDRVAVGNRHREFVAADRP